MPYVSNGTNWGIDDSEIPHVLRANQLFRPVAGVLPAAAGLTVGALSGTAQSYTNPVVHYWNSGAFNTQGQRWEGDEGDPANGCNNAATTRTSGGVHYNHITECEFLAFGQAFDIAFIGTAQHEVLVYVEHNGRMYRAEATPRAGTSASLQHLPLNFGARFTGRIRVVLSGGWFVGVKCEQSSIIQPSPDRHTVILDGAEWMEGEGIKQASGTSYRTCGTATYLFEKTGFVGVYRAQPDTGYFHNGTAVVTADTAGTNNRTRFFSADRRAWLEPDLAAGPLFYVIAGARADGGGNSGATGSSLGPMAVRAKECYDWIFSQDRLVSVVQMSVTPNGSGTGHDLNIAEQVHALEASRLRRPAAVNALSPAWYTTAQRAPLIGVDTVNPNDDGFQMHGSKIADALGGCLVSSLRARRVR